MASSCKSVTNDTMSDRAPTYTSISDKGSIPAEVLARLSPDSRQCVQRLLDHEEPPLPDFGLVKQAAVLLALFERPGGELEVLLTTRAKTMRRQPSQTALPGGKVDPEDESPYHTARREAYEEVDLSLDTPHVHYLTTLEPVITVLPLGAHYRNHIVVMPIVVLISDPTIMDHLKRNPEEVDFIFSHPLRGILDGHPSEQYRAGLETMGGEWWPHDDGEFHSIADRLGVTGPHRMHRFRTSKSPVKGLTSDILIQAATIAYSAEPKYDRYAPEQEPFTALLSTVVAELPGILDQDEKDRLAGKLPDPRAKIVEWGAIGGGPGVRSAETWSAT